MWIASMTLLANRDNWFNHIRRMDHSRFPRYMLSYKPTGKSSLGRPSKRWISQIWGTAMGKSPMHEVEEEEENNWCLFWKLYEILTTGWTTGRSGFDPRRGQRIFPLTSVSRPALGPTQPSVQWVPGVLSPGAKARPGRDADHSPPSIAEVVNE
jgi:hypothetical protein